MYDTRHAQFGYAPVLRCDGRSSLCRTVPRRAAHAAARRDEDILVPTTIGMRGWPPLHYFPWSRKIERAMFRGREYCHTRGYAYAKGVCSRTYMALMSQVR